MRYDHYSMLPERAFTKRCGRMTYEGGKNDTAPEPDYTPLANASERAAELGYDLGNKQLAENTRQYENNMAVAAPIIQAQTAAMTAQNAQAADYYQYNKDTFRPVEQSLAADAMKFSTAGAKEGYARTAAADLEHQQANESAQSARAMAAMGVNPNSAKFVALNNQKEVTNAAARAGAVTTARDKADSTSWAKRMDVTGLGRGLSGASTAAYASANNSGNSAVANQNSTAAQYINGIASGNGTIMQGSGQQIRGLGGVLSAQTSAFNSSQGYDNTGALIGALGGIGAAAIKS